MEKESESSHGDDARHQPQAAVAAASDCAEETRFSILNDSVRTLPADAVDELLSVGVCIACIFRLFGLRECLSSGASISASMNYSILEKGIGLEGIKFKSGFVPLEGSNGEQNSQAVGAKHSFCKVCMGILQFVYLDNNELLVKKDSADDFAQVIADMVKNESHQIDSFSLEVSIPPSVLENEDVARSYVREKYGSNVWFQDMCVSKYISTKDALELSLTSSLETLLGVKSGSCSFYIRLTYTLDSSTITQITTVNNQCNKRRKIGSNDDSANSVGSEVSGIWPSKKNEAQDTSENFKFPLGEASKPSHLTFLCYRTPIYIGGRYLKYSRNVSQSRWIIDDERVGEASVEEILGSGILPVSQGDRYKFHAAGREDIDVRMLGSGRPFLIEIQNPRKMPCEASIKDMEERINSLESKLVRVKNLKVLGDQGWNLMREGEAEKQKQYAALVWISRALNDDDMRTIALLKDMKILQRTPVRVLHRRSPLERERIIHWMKVEPIAGSPQYFLLHLCTQAGTYIKEFVHGDLGRTNPSIGSILGCRAEILQLDVTNVKMDC